MRIKKGDYVQVISGTETGKRGKVLRVLLKKNRVIVEGLNYIYRHLKKNQKSSQGGRVEKEAPLHVSNVMLYCHHSQSPTRTSYRYEEVAEQKKKTKEQSQGEQAPASEHEHVKHVKVRYSKKSKRQI